MAGDKLPPVIFLAFANVHDDRIRYLRNLPEEARQLRQLLTKAKREKLCTFILRENATLDDILDVFQHTQYERRISLFHFGGHANGYQLLMESATGKSVPAMAHGLAAFFGQQSGLELVFLNGCSTQRQVEGLLEAGVSIVIATLCDIDDKVATNFAIRFYKGLGSGASIETAFKEAQAAIQAGTAQVRHLYAADQLTAERVVDQWPWAIYTRKGAESALQWNLPDAADNPLFGLPEVEHTDLPQLPFRHLNWFDREHAAIFFGRGYQIRNLYQRITARAADEPIILLYGQSGVGKSSLLDAGLRPYLEKSHQIVYQRRDPAQGLSATLQSALDTPAAMLTAESWRKVEKRLGKPLVIILDQVEELFTQVRPELSDELGLFFNTLQTIFADRTRRPQGRLILSFRKEWLAEINKQMLVHKLPCAEILVERLDRRGIVEAVIGIAQARRLKQHYGLTVAPEVGGIIADDLLMDAGSPVAPILQILLAEMWTAAKKENYDHPHFSLELYQQIKAKGLSLEDFLEKQFTKLQETHKDEVASGLALDILAYHTTRLGTAEQHSEVKLQESYAHCQRVLPALLQRFKDLYLLVDLTHNQPEAGRMSRLAHDTLAPIVRARFEESDQPGQRALRILVSRALDWEEKQPEPLDATPHSPSTEQAELETLSWHAIQEQFAQAGTKARERRSWLRWTLAQTLILAVNLGRTNQIRLAQSMRSWVLKSHKSKGWVLKILAWLQKEQPTLDDQDLALVERGETGMRMRTTAEERLVSASKVARTRRRLTLATFVIFLLGALFFNGFLWQARQWAAFDQQRAIIGRLADQAQQLLTINPLLALQLSRTALPNVEQPYVPKAEFVFHAAVHALLARQVLPVSAPPVTIERFAWGETRFAVADANLIKLITYQLEPTRTVTLTGHLQPVSAIQWHEDRQTLLSYDQQSVRIWRDGEQRALYESNLQAPITCAYWRPEHNEEVAFCQGNTVQLWSPVTNNLVPLHTFTDTVNMVAWSPEGQRLAAWDNQQTLWIMQMVTETVVPQRLAAHAHPKRIRGGVWSGDGQHFVTVSIDGTLRLWSPEHDEHQDWQWLHNRALIGAQFISNTHFITWGGTADTARLWSIDKRQERWFGSESDGVQSIRYDNHGLMTFANNGDVQLWEVESGRRLALFRGHSNYVVDAQWQGTKLATASTDGTARVWAIDQTQQSVTRELVVKENPIILYRTESINNNQRNDVLGIAWSDDQHLLTITQDGKLRSWQVYDAWGQPLCQGVDGDGFPRCFNQSQITAMNEAPIVTAQWIHDDTILATTNTTVVKVAAGGTSSYTLPITPMITRTVDMVWRPDSSQVFTYIKALTVTDLFTGVVYGVPDGAVNGQIPGPIESAFWLEPGLLISRPFTEVIFMAENPDETLRTFVRSGCKVEQRCALTTVALHSTGLLAIGDERGVVYLWNLQDEPDPPFTLAFSEAEACATSANAAPIDTETPIDNLIWFNEGNQLLVAGRTVVLWDVVARKALWCYQSAGLKTHIALSPDEQLVAVTMDREFHVLDAVQGQPLWRNDEHDESVLGLQWTYGRIWPHQLRPTLSWPDGVTPWLKQEQSGNRGDERLLLLTWSGDGTARLWEWSSWSEIFRAPSADRKDPIRVAGINEAGTQLFTATERGVLRVWPLWLQTPEKAMSAVAVPPLQVE